MTDYKNTLNLPKTDFPMKANLPAREPDILAHWHSIDLSKKQLEIGKDRPKFILHDGPPYANGSIHLGTALNKILKDMVLKSKTLSGYSTPFVPGWDCHGLPIELFVEKKVGKAGINLSHKEFRQACREFAASQVEIQKKDFQRLGVIGNWEKPYLTMNFAYEANVIKTLSKIIANGHLIRGQKPVNWCTACCSALAEAEVEYKEKSSPAIDVAFDVVNVDIMKEKFGINQKIDDIIVPIWTTTPWTLPANEAVALHPDVEYVLVKSHLDGQETFLVIAEALLADVMHRYGLHEYQVLAVKNGKILEGLKLKHPFLDREVPIILGEHVTIETGTGAVHTAPAHGQDDYIIGQKYNLPMKNPVNSKSCFIEGTPLVAGQHVFKANEPIIVAIADNGKLLHQASITHSYPHCWRHKTPLIFRATPQWFISMEEKGLREMALKAIKEVKWMPSWGELRITKMIENRPDWCISRQRTWGIPITLFIHKKTAELHPNTPKLMEKIIELISQSGIDAWYDLDPADLLGKEAEDYEKVEDILDVWFDSGVSHACVLEVRPELSCPADLYLEGTDQHRGWFQTSLLTSLALREKAPYKKVFTHGYVVDAKGLKMSKSVGNVILPSDVIKKMGADVLRLWVASVDSAGDPSFSDEILKRISDAYRRIRNTARFLLSNLNDFDPDKDKVADNELLALDHWAIATAKQFQQKIIEAFDRYQFQMIYQLIHNFCANEMGSFYLDIIKDRQYTSKKSGVPRRSSQTAMYHIIEAMVRWLAPILSFTAEEIWKNMPGKRSESVFLSTWYEEFPAIKESDEEKSYWKWLMQVRDEVNKALEDQRGAGLIGSALDADVILYGENSIYDRLSQLGDELRFLLITSGAKIAKGSERSEESQTTAIEGLWLKISPSAYNKCARCWQRVPDIGTDRNHPDICQRCVINIEGEGETRKFA